MSKKGEKERKGWSVERKSERSREKGREEIEKKGEEREEPSGPAERSTWRVSLIFH